MKTICTDTDRVEKPISEAIEAHLGDKYATYSQVINFKNYGACSSRSRTVVIGVRKDLSDFISPFELFPDYQEEKTLREVISNLPALREFGEISTTDIYHAFRVYPEHMRSWITDLKEGESAFDQSDISKVPHKVVDGEIVVNIRKMGISIAGNTGIRSDHVSIQGTISSQARTLYTQATIEFSVSENL